MTRTPARATLVDRLHTLVLAVGLAAFITLMLAITFGWTP